MQILKAEWSWDVAAEGKMRTQGWLEKFFENGKIVEQYIIEEHKVYIHSKYMRVVLVVAMGMRRRILNKSMLQSCKIIKNQKVGVH
jgi:hypothetical protein